MQIIKSKTIGDANMGKSAATGLSIQFIEETCLKVSLPLHEDKYKPMLMRVDTQAGMDPEPAIETAVAEIFAGLTDGKRK